jgi:hypothetical protein
MIVIGNGTPLCRCTEECDVIFIQPGDSAPHHRFAQWAAYADGENRMQERAAGSPAKFSDILGAMPDNGARTARDVAGTIAQRGAVQGVGASP